MPEAPIERVFVFPLKDVVFFPRTTIPLNIFEPRYIQMVRDAVEKNIPIALCQPPASESVVATRSAPKGARRFTQTVAGMGTPQILHENPDGSMVIALKGQAKIHLLDVIEEKPYIVCQAVAIDENSKLDPKNIFRLNRLYKIFKDWADQNIEDPVERQHFSSSMREEQQLIETMGLFFIEETEDRQHLLELDDINERLEFVSKHLPSESPQASVRPLSADLPSKRVKKLKSKSIKKTKTIKNKALRRKKPSPKKKK